MNIGYACINMQLSYPQQYGGQERGVLPITTGRSMIRRTFDSKGIVYASEKTLSNCSDLEKIEEQNTNLNNIQNRYYHLFHLQFFP